MTAAHTMFLKGHLNAEGISRISCIISLANSGINPSLLIRNAIALPSIGSTNCDPNVQRRFFLAFVSRLLAPV